MTPDTIRADTEHKAEIIAALRELADGDGVKYRTYIFAALRLISTASEDQ